MLCVNFGIIRVRRFFKIKYKLFKGDPIMTLVLIQTKDNSNMFKKHILNETLELQKYLLNDFRIYANDDNITYSSLCDSCKIINIFKRKFIL